MDISILREYKVLSERLNFTVTAKLTHISQPVLSRHMKALEQELGFKLIDRDKGNISLTSSGVLFAEKVTEILMLYDGALRSMAWFDGVEQTLRVSYSSPSASSFLDGAYCELLKMHPTANVRLLASYESRVRFLLSSDEADIAITAVFDEVDPEVYDSLVLYRDSYSLLVPRTSPLAARESIDPQALSSADCNCNVMIPSEQEFPYQHKHLIDYLGKLPGHCSVEGSLNDKHDFWALVDAGRGYSLMPSRWARKSLNPDVVAVPIDDPSLDYEVCALWKKDNANPLLLDFIDILGSMPTEDA